MQEFILKTSLIPIASALIVGTLLYSYLNTTSDEHIKIKLDCLGNKKFIAFLIIFLACAAISSFITIIPGPPFYCFGYPIFWNILSLITFCLFLYFSYKLLRHDITYTKGNEEKYYKYIQKCISKNIPVGKYINSVTTSIEELIAKATSATPLIWKDKKLTNQDIEKNAFNTLGLLSAKYVAQFIVENDEDSLKKILEAYENAKERFVNTSLLNSIVQETVLDDKSLLRRKNYNNGKYEFNQWLSDSLVSKYDLLLFFNTSLKNFDYETLKVYKQFFIHILSLLKKEDDLKFGLFANLDYINMSIIDNASYNEMLVIEDIASELLVASIKSKWILRDRDMQFSLNRFINHLEKLYIKYKKDDYTLQQRLSTIWGIIKTNQNEDYIIRLLDNFFNTQQNLFYNRWAIKIFLLMEWNQNDFDYYYNSVIPFLKNVIDNGSESEKNELAKHIPFGRTLNDLSQIIKPNQKKKIIVHPLYKLYLTLVTRISKLLRI